MACRWTTTYGTAVCCQGMRPTKRGKQAVLFAVAVATAAISSGRSLQSALANQRWETKGGSRPPPQSSRRVEKAPGWTKPDGAGPHPPQILLATCTLQFTFLVRECAIGQPLGCTGSIVNSAPHLIQHPIPRDQKQSAFSLSRTTHQSHDAQLPGRTVLEMAKATDSAAAFLPDVVPCCTAARRGAGADIIPGHFSRLEAQHWTAVALPR